MVEDAHRCRDPSYTYRRDAPSVTSSSRVRQDGRSRGACPSYPPPARPVCSAQDPALASSAARSRHRLQHRQQGAQMIRLEARLNHKTAAGPQAHLDRSMAATCRLLLPRGCRSHHFHNLTTIAITQPFLPRVELPPAQASLTAKRLHALAGSHLFRYQPPPLGPRLCTFISHPSPIQPLHPQHRMWLT